MSFFSKYIKQTETYLHQHAHEGGLSRRPPGGGGRRHGVLLVHGHAGKARHAVPHASWVFWLARGRSRGGRLERHEAHACMHEDDDYDDDDEQQRHEHYMNHVKHIHFCINDLHLQGIKASYRKRPFNEIINFYVNGCSG